MEIVIDFENVRVYLAKWNLGENEIIMYPRISLLNTGIINT